jgi:hypothetical protein
VDTCNTVLRNRKHIVQSWTILNSSNESTTDSRIGEYHDSI